MQSIRSLEPKEVFKHFRTICDVPHCSQDERRLSDKLVVFAKGLGLDVTQDEAFNLVIRKPASKGRENAPEVILQAHIDMVCVKREGSGFDFSEDAIDLKVEEGFLKAYDTTLGADNGIAVAMIMAILEDDALDHPPLTALFTVGEEIGMVGVSKLDPILVSGDILINLDAEDEGIFYAACAGGVRNLLSLPVQHAENDTASKGYKVRIDGLKGGHSGLEIDKGRGNAIHLLSRVLSALDENVAFSIHRVSGGEKMNAIPKYATAEIALNAEEKDAFQAILDEMEGAFKDELASTDSNVKVSYEESGLNTPPLEASTKTRLLSLLRLIPTGVNTMSADIPGLVESSTNLGVLTTGRDAIEFESALRSSKKSLKDEIAERITLTASAHGAHSTFNASYPEWPFQKHSPIRNLMRETYESLTGKKGSVSAIHGGLESGFLLEKLGKLDVVAIGPDIHDVHTPEEALDIKSTERTYRLLRSVLSKIDEDFPSV